VALLAVEKIDRYQHGFRPFGSTSIIESLQNEVVEEQQKGCQLITILSYRDTKSIAVKTFEQSFQQMLISLTTVCGPITRWQQMKIDSGTCKDIPEFINEASSKNLFCEKSTGWSKKGSPIEIFAETIYSSRQKYSNKIQMHITFLFLYRLA
jgi:hypothetical protein